MHVTQAKRDRKVLLLRITVTLMSLVYIF